MLGSGTGNIVLDEPKAMVAISSPVRLKGRSVAFEANVGVEVRQDDARQPVGTGYVMGGAMEELQPFDGSVVFADPQAPLGAVVLFTASMENGNIWEATVVRVRFGAPGALRPSRPCPDFLMRRPQAGPGQMVSTVFYTCGADLDPVPTYRLVPQTSAALRSALDQLVAGPTAIEANAGLTSWFSPATAFMIDSVSIRAGHAVVDFRDLREVIPNASTSAGSRLLLSQLDATVFQFASVHSVEYRLEGDCAAFNEWLQFGGCEPRRRS